jgi:hypothetical protein
MNYQLHKFMKLVIVPRLILGAPLAALGILCLFCLSAHAAHLELGVDVTGTHLHKIDQAPTGVGGRLFWNFTKNVAADVEVVRYPGKTSALAGMKYGLRLDRFGAFGKVRAGMWHFNGTYPATDLGGVLEYYPSAHTTVRLDIGDTVLFYGGAALGTVHNFQPGVGFSYRF